MAPKSRENSRRTGLAEELSAVQPTLIWRDQRNTQTSAKLMSHVLKEYAAFGEEFIKAVFAYLKLDDSVLIYVNVSGGNRMLSKLTGDKHQR